MTTKFYVIEEDAKATKRIIAVKDTREEADARAIRETAAFPNSRFFVSTRI